MTGPVPPRLVLDSFAVLAFYRAERGGSAVRDLLRQARHGEADLAMSVINLGEVFYRTIREHGIQLAQEMLADFEEYPVAVVDVDQELALAAANLKGLYRMSYADCIAAALALRLDAAVVTGDPDFRQVEDRVAIEWLPTPQ